MLDSSVLILLIHSSSKELYEAYKQGKISQAKFPTKFLNQKELCYYQNATNATLKAAKKSGILLVLLPLKKQAAFRHSFYTQKGLRVE